MQSTEASTPISQNLPSKQKSMLWLYIVIAIVAFKFGIVVALLLIHFQIIPSGVFEAQPSGQSQQPEQSADQPPGSNENIDDTLDDDLAPDSDSFYTNENFPDFKITYGPDWMLEEDLTASGEYSDTNVILKKGDLTLTYKLVYNLGIGGTIRCDTKGAVTYKKIGEGYSRITETPKTARYDKMLIDINDGKKYSDMVNEYILYFAPGTKASDYATCSSLDGILMTSVDKTKATVEAGINEALISIKLTSTSPLTEASFVEVDKIVLNTEY